MKVWSSTIGSDIGLVRGSVVGGLFIPALGIDLSYHFSSTSDGADQLTCIKIFAARSWNIYRDFLLKPRFRVGLRIADRPTISPDRPRLWWSLNSKKVWGPYLALRVVNFGPGLLVVTAAVIRIKSGTKISVERVLAEKLGTELEKGQLVNILIPNRDECILDKNPLAIGIRDSFGRVRWAPTEDLKRVQREHQRLASVLSGLLVQAIPRDIRSVARFNCVSHHYQGSGSMPDLWQSRFRPHR